MAKQAKKTIEAIVADAAKRLDGIVAKAGRANGIVTARNFRISQGNVYLQGSELSMVGNGYSVKGTVEEQVNGIVDAIEASLKGAKKPASKSEAKRIAEQKGADGGEQTDGEGEGDEDAEGDGEGEEDDVKITDVSPQDAKLGEYLALSVKDLKDMCASRKITVPRGATKQVLAELLVK